MLIFWQQNGAVRGNGAEQARSLRAPPVVDARIAKDIVEFNAARGPRISAVVCRMATGSDLS